VFASFLKRPTLFQSWECKVKSLFNPCNTFLIFFFRTCPRFIGVAKVIPFSFLANVFECFFKNCNKLYLPAYYHQSTLLRTCFSSKAGAKVSIVFYLTTFFKPFFEII